MDLNKNIVDIMHELNDLTGMGEGTIHEAEMVYRDAESHYKSLEKFLKVLQAELEIQFEDMSAWKAKNRALTNVRYKAALNKLKSAHSDYSCKKIEYNHRKDRKDVLEALLIAEQSLAKLGR